MVARAVPAPAAGRNQGGCGALQQRNQIVAQLRSHHGNAHGDSHRRVRYAKIAIGDRLAEPFGGHDGAGYLGARQEIAKHTGSNWPTESISRTALAANWAST